MNSQKERKYHAEYSVHIKGTPTTKKNDCEYTKQNVVAFTGKVVVVAYADDFFGGDESKNFRSRVLTNPTWGSLFRVFKSQMKATKDQHHCFLEGARVICTKKNTKGEMYREIELVLGS
jgi:hypothetical protein